MKEVVRRCGGAEVLTSGGDVRMCEGAEVRMSELFTEADIERLRGDFPILGTKVHDKPLVYLDSAATTLKPKSVVEAVSRHYLYSAANVHRGVHYLSEQNTIAFEDVRTRIAAFIGARDRSEIVFTRGTTEAINLVALGYGRSFLKAGDEVVITHMEHHSNIVPWQMLRSATGCVLRVIPITDAGELDIEAAAKIVGPRTRLLSAAYVSNALGTVNDVAELTRLARLSGAKVLIDAAQAVAHLPVDVAVLDCDFLAFSGHKMFGPTGIGVLYGRAELLDAMPPVFGGGDMIDTVSFEKTTYNVIPHKFEAGTPHIAGVIGLGAALEYLKELGFTRIRAREKAILEYAVKHLGGVEGLRFIGTPRERSGVVSFVIEGVHPHDLGTLLDMEGMAIRTGHHCAQPLMRRFGVTATARASFGIYNTFGEIDAFFAALQKVKTLF